MRLPRREIASGSDAVFRQRRRLQQVAEREQAQTRSGPREELPPVARPLPPPTPGTQCFSHLQLSIDVNELIEPQQRLAKIGQCLQPRLVRLRRRISLGAALALLGQELERRRTL